MGVFTCTRCTKKFTHKGTYTRHMNRKFPCKIAKSVSIDKSISTPIKCKSVDTVQLPDRTSIDSQKGGVIRNIKNSNGLDGSNKVNYNVKTLETCVENTKNPAAKKVQNAEDNRVKSCKNFIECSYCNKTFTRTSSLNKHVRDRCSIKRTHDIKTSIWNLIEQLQTNGAKIDEIKECLNEVQSSPQSDINPENKNVINNNTNNINIIDNSKNTNTATYKSIQI